MASVLRSLFAILVNLICVGVVGLDTGTFATQLPNAS